MTRPKTIRSCYEYPLRSLLLRRRAYVLLAMSMLCMVILSASVLIYYASSYEAELETMRREEGPHHTVFYDLDPEQVSDYTEHPAVRDAWIVNLYASAYNPDTMSSLSQVFFTDYSEDTAADFYLRITAGRAPEAFGEILVSERAARYYPCFTLGETQDVTLYAQKNFSDVPLHVVGTFTGSSAAEEYVFCTPETTDYFKGDGTYGYFYSSDVYLTFKGNNRVDYRKGMQTLLSDLGLQTVSEKEEEGNRDYYYNERNDLMTAWANARPFYERETVQLMFLFSILPEAIALTVFLYLDMQKNLSELAALSMIGTTGQQIFLMQLIKYGILFCLVFPVGILLSAAVMRGVCAAANRISPDRVFLWYRFEPLTVLVLFLVTAAILTAVVYGISRKMTGEAHSRMLSAVRQSGQIFVSHTSGLLFGGKRVLDRIAMLFFSRNRRVNRLFCVVLILLVCIDLFFTVQAVKSYGEAPRRTEIDTVDFYLRGDSDLSEVYDTVTPELEAELQTLPGLAFYQRELTISPFFEYLYELQVRGDIQKQLVNNATVDGQFGMKGSYKIYKRGDTVVRLIGADEKYARMVWGKDLAEGDFSALYQNENTVAITVNGWAGNHEKYYHPGDVLPLKVVSVDPDTDCKSVTEWADYTVGAVIYRPDEYAYTDIFTVVCSPETFTELTGISDVTTYAVKCADDRPETLSAMKQALAELELPYHFTITDTHEELRQAKEQALHAVLFVCLLKLIVLSDAVLLLIAMSRFLLEVRAPSIRALHLIGTDEKQLSHINQTEFFAASAASSLAGLLLSVTGIIAVTVKTELFWTPVTVVSVVVSMVLLTAVHLLVPYLVCRRKMKELCEIKGL